MAIIGDIYRTASAHRAEMLRLERDAAERIIWAYDRAARDIGKSANRLTQQIALARSRGEDVSPGWLARQERYGALLAQIDQEMQTFGAVSAGTITKAQAKAVELAGEHARKSVASALGVKSAGAVGMWNRLPAETFRDLVGFLAEGSPLRELFLTFGPEASTAARAALFAGVAAGEHPTRIARRLREALDTSASRALLIARTENHRAYREATRREYLAAPSVRGWIWWCSLTKRTCASCFAMHGTRHHASERMGSHPACRCMMIPDTGSGATANVQTGEDYFRNNLTDADRLAILGPGKFDAWKRGDIELQDLVRTRDSLEWGRQRTVSSLKDALRAAEIRKLSPPPPPVAVPPPPPPPVVGGAGVDGPAALLMDLGTAQQWAEKRWPQITFDFAGAHIDTVRPTLEAFEDMANQYPEVAARLQYFGTYQGPPVPGLPWGGLGKAYAHASRDGKRIAINHEYYGDPAKLARMLASDAAEGWHPPGSENIGSVVVHEFGHQIHNWLKAQSSTAWTSAVRSSGAGTIRNTVDDFMRSIRQRIKISGYAKKSEEEAFAEMVAAVKYTPRDKWNTYTKRMAALLDQAKNGKRYNRGEWEFLGSLTQEEREAARKELAELYKRLGMKEPSG